MSTVSSSLSPGLQHLSDAGLLSPALSTQQLQKTSTADINKLAQANLKASAANSLYASSSSSSSDSVSDTLSAILGGSATSSTKASSNPLLTFLKAAYYKFTSVTPSSSTTASTTNSNPIAKLFG